MSQILEIKISLSSKLKILYSALFNVWSYDYVYRCLFLEIIGSIHRKLMTTISAEALTCQTDKTLLLLNSRASRERSVGEGNSGKYGENRKTAIMSERSLCLILNICIALQTSHKINVKSD